MVHIAKRMRSFQPLLSVKYGHGALNFPPPPAPQLTEVHVRWPTGGQLKEQAAGALAFKGTFLPQLRYRHPLLPITVEHAPYEPGMSILLTLQFEGTDRNALQGIAAPSKKAPNSLAAEEKPSDPTQKPKSQLEDRSQSKSQVVEGDTSKPRRSFTRRTASDDQVVLKPQPAADPSAPSTISPPAPIYTRSVSLPLNGREFNDIARWFQRRTNSKRVPMRGADRSLSLSLGEFAEKSELDRERVKTAMDAMKREKADLKRAREAADRLAAEAV